MVKREGQSGEEGVGEAGMGREGTEGKRTAMLGGLIIRRGLLFNGGTWFWESSGHEKIPSLFSACHIAKRAAPDTHLFPQGPNPKC